MSTQVYLGLGSNVGDRESHLRHALRRLAEEAELTGTSSVYETDPVGYADQRAFLNMVARITTDLPPESILGLARRIETERQRLRPFRGAPRTLDVDVLLYGDLCLDEPGLTIPHPRMKERAFVLVPLLEVAPAAVDPETGRPLREYLELATTAENRGREEPAAGLPGINRIGSGEKLRNG